MIPIRRHLCGDIDYDCVTDQLTQRDLVHVMSTFGKMHRRINMRAAMFCGRDRISRVLEAVSILSVVALGPEISDSKAPCAGNSGAISKRGNAASADFRVQPVGPGPFSCISALFVAH